MQNQQQFKACDGCRKPVIPVTDGIPADNQTGLCSPCTNARCKHCGYHTGDSRTDECWRCREALRDPEDFRGEIKWRSQTYHALMRDRRANL